MIRILTTLLTASLTITSAVLLAQTNQYDTISSGGYSSNRVKTHRVSKPMYKSYKALGFNMSPTSGLGFSYRQMDSRVGMEATLLPIFIQGNLAFMSLGLSGIYKLNRIVYTGVSTSYWRVDTDNAVNASVNIGIEGTLDNVGAKLGTGYGVYNISNKFSTLPSIEFGVYVLIGK